MQQHSVLTAIGLMSGTSMDGIDAALIRTDGVCHIDEIAAIHLPYTAEFQFFLKAVEFTLKQYQGNLTQARLNFANCLSQYRSKQHYASMHDDIDLNTIFEQSLQLHYQAVLKLLEHTNLTAAHIDVVGYHGQTFYHDPANKISHQIGDGRKLSQSLGIQVINNFRENDIQHGGQGAPFAPIYHQALAQRDDLIPCVVVNCGGVSNVSIISGHACEDLLGYDPGPGNGLLDRFVQQRAQQMCDQDGKYGLKGKVDERVLQLLFEKSCLKQDKNYFTVAPPKSLDVNDFVLIDELELLTLEDGCATLAAFSAKMIVESLKLIPQGHDLNTWIVAGGGWKNPNIVNQLRYYLRDYNPNATLYRATEVAWNEEALEAQLMAFLAVRRLSELPISFPWTTAVPRPLIGGDIYYA